MKTAQWAWSVLLAALCAGPAFAEGRNDRNDRCYAVRVGPAEGDSRSGRSDRVFSAASAKDLVVEISLSDEVASRPVRVHLFTPRDRLYQVIEASAFGQSDDHSRRRRQRGRTLAAHFPLAGTQVTTYALYGEWRAEVYLDGADAPCARPLEFFIER